MNPVAAAALLALSAVLFVAVTAFGSIMLVGVLHPLLVRYALARPNARSAHTVPTPQGGGIVVLIAMGVAAVFGAAALGAEGPTALGFGAGSRFAVDAFGWNRLLILLAAATLIALVGLVDDLRPLPPLPRLALQLIAMATAVSALPGDLRVLPFLPLGAERVLLILGGAWFVNLTNFMDGMDWLTVVEMVPITAALSIFWGVGSVSAPAGIAMLALCGALLGFAPFNRPVATLFLGDVGSLAIGLLVAYGLYDLAGHGALAAAVLLPLYFIADSGITLGWRLKRRDRVWEAHRHHFYQVATSRGMSEREVLARVAITNAALVGFAAASLWQDSIVLSVVDVLLGVGVVSLLLVTLARGRPSGAPAA